MSGKWLRQGLLFDASQGPEWMHSHVAVPIADYRGGDRYRIVFSSRNRDNMSRPGYIDVEFGDRAVVRAISSEPLMEPGPAGTFDDSGVLASCLVRYKDTRYLYYTGWNRSQAVPFRNAIGLALTQDVGDTLVRHSAGPILDRSIHDPCFVSAGSVLVEEGLWRMWYQSCIQWAPHEDGLRHYYHIKYAESDDGIEWRRNGHVCIDFANPDEYAISRPCVLKDSEGYRMWYSYRGTSYRIGYAESVDGLHWVRRDSQAGIDVSPSGWDSQMIEYPFVFDHGRRRILLYNGNGYGQSGLGWAVWEED